MKIWFYQTTESIGQNHRPLYVRPRKCHLLHNLHTTPEDRLRRSREMIGGPLSRESSRVSKQVASHFNFTNNFHHNMTICGLSNTESRKKIKKKSFFNQAHAIHTESMNASYTINLFTNSCDRISTNAKALSRPHKNQQQLTIPVFALTKG